MSLKQQINTRRWRHVKSRGKKGREEADVEGRGRDVKGERREMHREMLLFAPALLAEMLVLVVFHLPLC